MIIVKCMESRKTQETYPAEVDAIAGLVVKKMYSTRKGYDRRSD